MQVLEMWEEVRCLWCCSSRRRYFYQVGLDHHLELSLSNLSGSCLLLSHSTFSLSSSIDVSFEDPSQSRAALQTALEKVTTELVGLKKIWTVERQTLVSEKTALRDTTARLTAEVRTEAAKVDQERRKAKEAAKKIQDEAERERTLIRMVRNRV